MPTCLNKCIWKIIKGGDSGAGVVVVAMVEMRLEVIVNGEGMVSMASGSLLSLFKVCGLLAMCVSDSGRVDVGEAEVSFLLDLCSDCGLCVRPRQGRFVGEREDCPLTVLSLTCLGVGHLL